MICSVRMRNMETLILLVIIFDEQETGNGNKFVKINKMVVGDLLMCFGV